MVLYAEGNKVARHNLLKQHTEAVIDAPFEEISELFLIQSNVAVALAGQQVWLVVHIGLHPPALGLLKRCSRLLWWTWLPRPSCACSAWNPTSALR
jgi:hypothetical protein